MKVTAWLVALVVLPGIIVQEGGEIVGEDSTWYVDHGAVAYVRIMFPPLVLTLRIRCGGGGEKKKSKLDESF